MKINVPTGTAFVFDARGVEYQIDSRRQIDVDPIHVPGLCYVSGGEGGRISSVVRNGSGEIQSYVQDGIAYTMTYNADGTVHTISGGGVVKTLQYDGSGQFSGAVVS